MTMFLENIRLYIMSSFGTFVGITITVLLLAVIAYLLGSFNTAIIISKLFLHEDIREKGSGNAGGTNMLRNYGKKMAIITLLFDFLKGFIAVNIGSRLFGASESIESMYGALIAGIFCIMGHVFPLYFGFKGGKGVMTTFSIVAVIDWRISLVCVVMFVVIVAFTRFVSLGSIIAGITFSIAMLLVYRNFGLFALSAVISIWLVYSHRTNIVRLRNGTENKISLSKK